MNTDTVKGMVIIESKCDSKMIGDSRINLKW